MGSVGLADFPGIDPNGDGNQYLQQYENALHEERLSTGDVPLSSSKTIGNHEGLDHHLSTDVPESANEVVHEASCISESKGVIVLRHGLADTILFNWLDGGDVPGAMGTGTSTGAQSPSLGEGPSTLDRDWCFTRDDHLGRRHLVLAYRSR